MIIDTDRDELLSISQVSKETKISAARIRDYIDSRKLTAVKTATRTMLVPRSSLVEFLATEKPEPDPVVERKAPLVQSADDSRKQTEALLELQRRDRENDWPSNPYEASDLRRVLVVIAYLHGNADRLRASVDHLREAREHVWRMLWHAIHDACNAGAWRDPAYWQSKIDAGRAPLTDEERELIKDWAQRDEDRIMHFEPVSGYEQIDNEYRYILGRPAEFKRTCDWCDFSQIWTHKYLPRSFNEMMLGGEDAAVAAVIHHMQREHPDELAARLASGPIRLPKRHSWHRSKPEPDELCPPPEDFGMQVGPGLPLPQLPVEYQPKPRKPKPKATA